MKYAPTQISKILPLSIAQNLEELRNKNGQRFNPQEYVEAKIEKLDCYFKQFAITTPVVAVSGGIDSAIVLGILATMRDRRMIESVVAITLPVTASPGVTGQINSAIRAKAIMRKFGVCDMMSNLNDISNALIMKVKLVTGSAESDKWADGQIIPYLRTTFLYSMTAYLASQEKRAVLVGTTNRSEGMYLGYIGKASDGMVDIQPISDIFKSEVYMVAEYLGVTEEIMNVEPTGDMFDGRTDEQVFGATYSSVEWALRSLGIFKDVKTCFGVYKAFCDSSGFHMESEFALQMISLDELHTYNRHKYLGCSPAVHMDIIPPIKTSAETWTYKVWCQES